MVLVHRHGVADIGADGDAIDIDDVDLVEAGLGQLVELACGQLVAGFDIDFARFGIDHVERGVAAEQLLVGQQHLLDAVFLPFAQRCAG